MTATELQNLADVRGPLIRTPSEHSKHHLMLSFSARQDRLNQFRRSKAASSIFKPACRIERNVVPTNMLPTAS
jgi:hypothetical protein